MRNMLRKKWFTQNSSILNNWLTHHVCTQLKHPTRKYKIIVIKLLRQFLLVIWGNSSAVRLYILQALSIKVSPRYTRKVTRTDTLYYNARLEKFLSGIRWLWIRTKNTVYGINGMTLWNDDVEPRNDNQKIISIFLNNILRNLAITKYFKI